MFWGPGAKSLLEGLLKRVCIELAPWMSLRLGPPCLAKRLSFARLMFSLLVR